jgi:hypothetical protein
MDNNSYSKFDIGQGVWLSSTDSHGHQNSSNRKLLYVDERYSDNDINFDLLNR